MNCKCKHEKVCQHKWKIETAFRPIIPLKFGSVGPSPESVQLSATVADICQYYEPSDISVNTDRIAKDTTLALCATWLEGNGLVDDRSKLSGMLEFVNKQYPTTGVEGE